MPSVFVAFLALFLVGLTYAQSPPIGGGFSAVKPADAEAQKAVDAVAGAIRILSKSDPKAKLIAQRYISQTVAGTNYVVELHSVVVGAPTIKILQAKITKDLTGKFTLTAVKPTAKGQAVQSW